MTKDRLGEITRALQQDDTPKLMTQCRIWLKELLEEREQLLSRLRVLDPLVCGTSSLRAIDSSELGERFLDC